MFNCSDKELKYGYISAFFSDKGYGFISETESEEEYFFHISNLEYRFDITPQKTKVVFLVKQNHKGDYAACIKEYVPRIEGKFGYIPLPNNKKSLTNSECYKFLKEQHAVVHSVLDIFKSNGVDVKVDNNGWISIDLSPFENIDNISPKGGIWEEQVPSGYPDTFANIIRLLQKQINNFNYSYNAAVKGYEGEQKTAYSLRAVAINYPVLHNVLLEEGNDTERYSAEADTIIITDRAIFIVETKNYGGKGDTITITEDGRWELFDKYKKTTSVIRNNPFKQSSDHVFVIKKFLDNNGFSVDLPVVPIIAIANNNVEIVNEGNGLIKVMRTELIGTHILQYIDSHSPVISKEELKELSDAFNSERLPLRRYEVVNYCDNIKVVCSYFAELIDCFAEDYKKHSDEIERRRLEKKKRQEENRKKESVQVQNSQHDTVETEQDSDALSGFGFLFALGRQIIKNIVYRF